MKTGAGRAAHGHAHIRHYCTWTRVTFTEAKHHFCTATCWFQCTLLTFHCFCHTVVCPIATTACTHRMQVEGFRRRQLGALEQKTHLERLRWSHVLTSHLLDRPWCGCSTHMELSDSQRPQRGVGWAKWSIFPHALTIAVVLGQVGRQRRLCLFAPASLCQGRKEKRVERCQRGPGREREAGRRTRFTLAAAPAVGVRRSLRHHHTLREVRPLHICKQRSSGERKLSGRGSRDKGVRVPSPSGVPRGWKVSAPPPPLPA